MSTAKTRSLCGAALAAAIVLHASTGAAQTEEPTEEEQTGDSAEIPTAGDEPSPDPTARAAQEALERERARVRALQAQLVAGRLIHLRGGTAYQGSSGVRLTGETFYEAVGRPDLRDQYRLRSTVLKIVGRTGTVLVVGGLLVGVFDATVTGFSNALTIGGCVFLAGTPSSSGERCQTQDPSDGPWIVAGLGLAMGLTAFVVPADPFSARERAALAEQYNARLRAAPDGGQEEPPAPRRSQGRPGSLGWAPFVSPQGGGLLVAGTF